jgi:hypothetical protein
MQLDENHIRNLNIRQAKLLNPSLLFDWLRKTVAIFTYRQTFLKTPALNYWDEFTNSVLSIRGKMETHHICSLGRLGGL